MQPTQLMSLASFVPLVSDGVDFRQLRTGTCHTPSRLMLFARSFLVGLPTHWLSRSRRGHRVCDLKTLGPPWRRRDAVPLNGKASDFIGAK